MSQTVLTARFETALAFAARLHIKQVRNGTQIPYVSHLLGTTSLALEHGADEDQAIAALLHDAVEDQGGTPTLQTIERLFGKRVARIVLACSDNPGDGEDIPWKERKVAYLEHLRDTDADARLVSASDKLHNARSILSDLRRAGDKAESVWGRFTPSPSEIAWYYRSLVETFKDDKGPASLAFELEPVVCDIEALARTATGQQ